MDARVETVLLTNEMHVNNCQIIFVFNWCMISFMNGLKPILLTLRLVHLALECSSVFMAATAMHS